MYNAAKSYELTKKLMEEEKADNARMEAAAMICKGCNQDLSKGVIEVKLMLWDGNLWINCPLCRKRQQVFLKGETIHLDEVTVDRVVPARS